MVSIVETSIEITIDRPQGEYGSFARGEKGKRDGFVGYSSAYGQPRGVLCHFPVTYFSVTLCHSTGHPRHFPHARSCAQTAQTAVNLTGEIISVPGHFPSARRAANPKESENPKNQKKNEQQGALGFHTPLETVKSGLQSLSLRK